jgi:hypothetical protein
MKRNLFSTLYLMVGALIGLGAFGHGAQGVRHLAPALEAVALPPDMAGVIRIVWYFVSGCMLTFGGLIYWAWFAAARGNHGALAVPAIIGGFYGITGLASFAYQPNPFWLLFSVEGCLLLIAAFSLRNGGAPLPGNLNVSS